MRGIETGRQNGMIAKIARVQKQRDGQVWLQRLQSLQGTDTDRNTGMVARLQGTETDRLVCLQGLERLRAKETSRHTGCNCCRYRDI